MKNAKRLHNDECLVYWSADDNCWIAHSLLTDQIGTGDCVVHAIADLLQAVKGLLELAAEDDTIQVLKPAAAEVRKLSESAKALPREIYEIAHKMVFGGWPDDMQVEFTPKTHEPFKTKLELIAA